MRMWTMAVAIALAAAVSAAADGPRPVVSAALTAGVMTFGSGEQGKPLSPDLPAFGVDLGCGMFFPPWFSLSVHALALVAAEGGPYPPSAARVAAADARLTLLAGDTGYVAFVGAGGEVLGQAPGFDEAAIGPAFVVGAGYRFAPQIAIEASYRWAWMPDRADGASVTRTMSGLCAALVLSTAY
jgi:hypothetical protein